MFAYLFPNHHARRLVGLLMAFFLVCTTGKSSSAITAPASNYDVLAQHLTGLGVAKTGYAVVINIPSFRLFLFQNGTLVRNYPIAVGKVVSPSNLGTASIINKVENPTYYPPDWGKKGLKPILPGPDNPVGTRWLGLSIKGYGIHGTNNPASIGRAASAGCIRMYNSDVEELSKLVPVGTPVTFRYEQVAVGFAADLQQMAIQVFADVYGQGTPSVANVLERIKKQGVQEPQNEEALRYILNRADGKPQPLPLDMPVTVEGYGTVRGYRVNNKLWVKVSGLAQLLGETWALQSGKTVTAFGQPVREAWTDAGVSYAPIDAVAEAFGMLMPNTATLKPITLSVGNAQVRLLSTESGILLPLSSMANALGLPIVWDSQKAVPLVDNQPTTSARMFAGRAYLPITETQAVLGIRVNWYADTGTVQISRPAVLFGNQREEGFWRDGALWFPFRPLAEALGASVTWDSIERLARVGDQTVPGALWGGRLYAAHTDIMMLFPQLTPVWHEQELVLEYLLPAPETA